MFDTRVRPSWRLWFGLSALLACSGAWAMDLREAYDLALQRDPVWRAAAHENRATAEDRRQAVAGYLPELELTYDYTHNWQNVVETETLVYQQGRASYPSHDLFVRLRQPILRLDRYAEIKRAEAQVKVADVEYARSGQELILRLAEHYFGVLRAADDDSFTQAERVAVRKNAELVVGRHAAGLARESDLRDAQARVAYVAAEEVATTQRLRDARQALRAIIEETPTAINPLRSRLELQRPDPEDVREWAEAAATQNLAVQVARFEVEVAREEIKRRRAGHYPSLDLVGRLNRRDTGDSLYGGGSTIDTADVSLQLRVPLYLGGRVSSEVRQGAELLGVAQEKLDRARREADRRARDSYEGVLSAIVRVEALQQAVEAQRLARKAKQESFVAGLFTLIAVLDADRDLASARRDLAQARYDYVLSSLRLKEAVGSLSENDLVLVNAWLDGSSRVAAIP